MSLPIACITNPSSQHLSSSALRLNRIPITGPETVDHAMIGTTRTVNPTTGMVEFTKIPPNAQHPSKKNPGLQPKPQVIYRLDPVRERGRLVFQIGTSDPDRAVAAARLVAADVAGIDVNAGCPKPFSTSGGMGAALLKTPDRLCAILRALVAAVSDSDFRVGVSVKIRLLDTPEETELLVSALCRTGITGLTIHCRTAHMRKTEPVDRRQLRMIVEVCRAHGVACLINGDVSGRDEGMRLAEEYGADGAMIATAAEKNPSCFRDGVEQPLAGWREVVEHFLRFAMEVDNKFGNTKYQLNILIPGREPVLKKVHGSPSYAAVCEVLGYPDLKDTARAVDDRLGISPEAKAREKAAKEAAVREKIREQQEQQKKKKDQEQQQQASNKRKYSDASPRSRSRSPRSPPRKVLTESEGNGNRSVVPDAPAPTATVATSG